MPKNAGAVISYDPNYRAPLWNNEKTAIERMRSMLPFADMIKLSDEETALLTPYENPDEAANYLLDHGIKIVAVTLGKEGVLICNRKDHQKVSGFFESSSRHYRGRGLNFGVDLCLNL